MSKESRIKWVHDFGFTKPRKGLGASEGDLRKKVEELQEVVTYLVRKVGVTDLTD